MFTRYRLVGQTGQVLKETVVTRTGSTVGKEENY